GWDEWLLGQRAKANKSSFIGMKSFGASAPAEVLFSHFGITPDEIVSETKNLL
ncbi:MAG: transketolase-like TK C-terminal-containing protein, partial [Paracoccaceae bacterium]